ncbi:MAG: hypothetical protein ACOCUL_02305 [Bacteroidota bacterium]
MTVAGIIFTIISALLIGLLFYYIFKLTGPWGSFWTFFLILLIAGLATIPWVEPVGPTIYDIAWIPIIFVILLFAILMAAATPTYNRGESRNTNTSRPHPNEAGAVAAAVGVFFWILLIFFMIAIIAGFWAV